MKIFTEILNIFTKHNKLIITLSKIVITIGVLGYMIYTISAHQIIDSFLHINYFYFSIALLLLIANIYFQFLRWKNILFSKTNELDNLSVFKSLMIGISAGFFTPFRIGEYFARKLPLNKFKLKSVLLLTFIDKLFLLIIVSLIGSLSLVFLLYFYFEVNYLITISLSLILLVLFYLIFQLLFSNSLFNYINENYINLEKKFKYLRFVIEEISNFNIILNLKLIFYSLINYFIIILQFGFLVLAFSPDSNFILNIYSGILILFTKSFFPAITLGELGIRESTSVYFLGLFNVSEVTAFNSSIMLFIINLLIPALFGLILLYNSQRKNNHNDDLN